MLLTSVAEPHDFRDAPDPAPSPIICLGLYNAKFKNLYILMRLLLLAPAMSMMLLLAAP
jgi:hypothetical protein